MCIYPGDHSLELPKLSKPVYSTVVDNRIFDKHWKRPARFSNIAKFIVKYIDKLLFNCNCHTLFSGTRIIPDLQTAKYYYESAQFIDGSIEYKCSRCGTNKLL